jgi:hypothetical protein
VAVCRAAVWVWTTIDGGVDVDIYVFARAGQNPPFRIASNKNVTETYSSFWPALPQPKKNIRAPRMMYISKAVAAKLQPARKPPRKTAFWAD